MATFEKLVQQRKIIPVVVPLPRGQFYDRKLYAFPECVEWMRTEVPKLQTGRLRSAQTPSEQLMIRVAQWLSGAPLKQGPMFAEMKRPPNSDVWELKTDDLRLWGWMYRPKEFIVASCGYADDYKEPTLIKSYAAEVRKVVAARDELPVDGPKCVRGAFDELI